MYRGGRSRARQRGAKAAQVRIGFADTFRPNELILPGIYLHPYAKQRFFPPQAAVRGWMVRKRNGEAARQGRGGGAGFCHRSRVGRRQEK
eukprot:SAG11_NODE_5911_length_1434_cov_4.065918_1_plen_89_part_10